MSQSPTAQKKSGDIELNEDDFLIGSKKALEAAKNKKTRSKKIIGKAAISAENQTKNKKQKIKPSINAETINRADLLQMAANIEVNGSNLGNIYDTKLISEKGLRRLVGLYVSGEDLRPALREEIIDETADLDKNQIIEEKRIDVYKRRRLIDGIIVASITTILVLLIVFMVSSL